MSAPIAEELVRHKWHANAAYLASVYEHEPTRHDEELRKLLHHILIANRFWLFLTLGKEFDRETEARLAATGCTPLIDPQADGAILFDIGGGSSELVRLARSQKGRGGPPLPQIRGWISVPHGVVTLAERHGGITVTRESYEAMVSEVAALIAPFVREHGTEATTGIHMLGTSGTVTTIAGVHLNLWRYDRNRVDGCWMSAPQIDAVIERLLAMSYEDRVASPCIGAERADLVLAGCAILEAIRRAFPCPRLRVADRGLREGMLVQMMREDGAWGGGNQTAIS